MKPDPSFMKLAGLQGILFLPPNPPNPPQRKAGSGRSCSLQESLVPPRLCRLGGVWAISGLARSLEPGGTGDPT